MSRWHTPIDIYCERTSPEFWAEPVNALTNAAFIVAAVIGWQAARRAARSDGRPDGRPDGRLDGGLMLLIALTACIGIGSFLFHTVATRWAALADVLPITLFIVTYLGLALRRFFGLRWPVAAGLAVGFVPAAMAIRAAIPPDVAMALGGSTGYLPALLALAVCGALLAARRHAAGGALLLGAGVFALSLSFRSLDAELCDALPLGTHFLWHLLNATLLGWLLVTMARYGRG